MFTSVFNLVREIRQRRADIKTTSVDGGNLDYAKLLEDSQKERNRLWENPPPCGSVIRYVQDCVYEKTYGEFLFRASDVEQAVIDILRENPHLANDDEGAIRNWIKGRDESIIEPTDVPSTWSRFKYLANNLVRTDKAEIHCSKCGTEVGLDQIATNDDSGKRGWNFDRVVCQHGHNLLVVDSVHLMI